MVGINNPINNLLQNQPIASVVSSSYTALTTDTIISVNFNGVVTITVPTASASNSGKVYVIKDAGGFAGQSTITIVPASGTIDGSGSSTIQAGYGFAMVHSNGSAWFTQTTSSGPVTPTTRTRSTLGSTFTSSTHGSYLNVGATVVVPAGRYTLRYNCGGSLDNNGAGTMIALVRIFDVSGGVPVTNSEFPFASMGYITGFTGGMGGSAQFDTVVTNSASRTYTLEAGKFTTGGSPNTAQNLYVNQQTYLEFYK